jgi:hypothetical protein
MRDALLVAVFVVALWLPLVGTVLRWGVLTPEQENRALAPFPSRPSSLRDLASLSGRFDDYLRDNFGFRGTLIRSQAFVRVKLLGVSSSPEVIMGKDGWLYYTDLYSNRGEPLFPPFTPRQLDYWRRVLEARRDWLAQRGVRYLFTIAPSKYTIYPEYLPDTFRRTGEETRLDQFVAYMKAHSDLEILDLRPELYRAKSSRQVYYKTDTHWNVYGAFVAYQAIISRLSKWFPSLQPVSESDCQVTTVNSPGGDIVRVLGLTGLVREDAPAIRLRSTPYRVLFSVPVSQAEQVNMVAERDDADLPRLVMLHDSASTRLMPFMAQHFSRTVFAWPLRFDTELIESERPDVVVEEIGEPLLSLDPPVDPLEVRSLKYPPEGSPPDSDGPKPDYKGHLDVANCQAVTGWAWDRARPEEPLDVAIYDGDTLLAVVPADHARDDLLPVGVRGGRGGFRYDFPRGTRDGRPHQIHARVFGSGFELPDSPSPLTCPRE